MPKQPSSPDEEPQSQVAALIARVRRSPLVANTISYTINFGLQLVIQLFFFMLVSRSLGASGYGVFVSITSVSIIAGLIIGLGSEYLLVQRVAVDPKSFPLYFGQSLIMMAVTFPLVAVPTLFFLHYLIGDAIELLPLCILSLSDLLFTRLIVLAANAYMAFDRVHKQLFINVFTAASKLCFLIAASTFSHLTVDIWAWWFFVSGALSAAVAMTLVVRDLGRPVFGFVREDLKLSGLYCIEFLSIGSMRDIDKPVVVHALDAGVRRSVCGRVPDHGCSLRAGARLSLCDYNPALPLCRRRPQQFHRLRTEASAHCHRPCHSRRRRPVLRGRLHSAGHRRRHIARHRASDHPHVASHRDEPALIPVVWFGATVGGLLGAAVMWFALQIVLIILTWVIVLRQKTGPSLKD
ncbi:hypothetical protein [Breoghania sp.]|uniref:lipopolysaccharide biosynthesis protein n=1 Tax=Breoghania sp. TaxID=2065378 RepID=UPI00260935A9|nr:hypothetical protein [Breoghania sp.]MDJ0930982.1 hypothetical protein [Breoghania sp.]